MNRCACPDPLTLHRIIRCTVDGNYAWRTRCASCGHLSFGVEPDQAQAEHASGPAIGGPDTVTRAERSMSLRRSLAVKGMPPLMQHILDRGKPFARPDPYVVVTDAGLKDGVMSWALVTGAGWEESGAHLATEIRNVKNEPLYSATGAELYAICRAVSLYPANSTIKVLTDCRPLVDDWHKFVRGHLLGRDWVPSIAQGTHGSNLKHNRTVRLEFMHSDKPLLQRAHSLAIHARLKFDPDSPNRLRPAQIRDRRDT